MRHQRYNKTTGQANKVLGVKSNLLDCSIDAELYNIENWTTENVTQIELFEIWC